LHLPLWDGGRMARNDGADGAEIDLRRLDAVEARSRIELEVRDAVRQMQDAARRQAVLAAASRLADELQRIDGERYERGLIDTQRLLSSQLDAATARLDSAESLLDLYRARARLRFVTLSEE
jgi:outer membrane protein TolC